MINTKLATLINPTTGQKEVVLSGSRQASQLFGEGFFLMGANERAIGYEGAPPTTPIAARPESQQSRSTSQLFGGLTPPPPVPEAPSQEGFGQFNTALMDVLKTYQGLNPASLQTRKNALLKAQFDRVSEITPEELRSLSPQEQSALRSADASAITPEIEGINEQITSYQGQIQNFGNVLSMASTVGENMRSQEIQEFQLKSDVESRNYQRQQDFQVGIQNQVFNMFSTFGPMALEGTSPEQIAQLEQVAGMPTGLISNGMAALQRAEEKAANNAEMEVLRQLAFSPEALESGQAPELFLKAFPELKSTWEAMSRVARERYDQERGLKAAQTASANRANQPSGDYEDEFTFSTSNINTLLGAGFLQTDIQNFETNIQNGNTVDDIVGATDLSDQQKNALYSTFGRDLTEEADTETENRQFLSADYFVNTYGETLKKAAQDAGYMKGGFLGIGDKVDVTKYAEETYMARVREMRNAGYKDREILKELQS